MGAPASLFRDRRRGGGSGVPGFFETKHRNTETARNVIAEGLELMVVGMGTVFAFLVLLVVVMSASGAFFTRNGLPEPEPTGTSPTPVPAKPASDDSARLAVAVAVAVAAAVATVHRTRCEK